MMNFRKSNKMNKEQLISLKGLSRRFIQYAIDNNFGQGWHGLGCGVMIYLCDNAKDCDDGAVNYDDEVDVFLHSNEIQTSMSFILEEKFELIYKSAFAFIQLLDKKHSK